VALGSICGEEDMSGGYFGYAQYKIDQISDQISEIIRNNDRTEFPFSPATIQRFTEAIRALEIAFVYARRVDWLVSGDDKEEFFEAKLLQDLAEVDEDLKA
jgi:hypothetical protein